MGRKKAIGSALLVGRRADYITWLLRLIMTMFQVGSQKRALTGVLREGRLYKAGSLHSWLVQGHEMPDIWRFRRKGEMGTSQVLPRPHINLIKPC